MKVLEKLSFSEFTEMNDREMKRTTGGYYGSGGSGGEETPQRVTCCTDICGYDSYGNPVRSCVSCYGFCRHPSATEAHCVDGTLESRAMCLTSGSGMG